MTRGDKLYESRGGEKFYGDTGHIRAFLESHDDHDIFNIFFLFYDISTRIYVYNNKE